MNRVEVTRPKKLKVPDEACEGDILISPTGEAYIASRGPLGDYKAVWFINLQSGKAKTLKDFPTGETLEVADSVTLQTLPELIPVHTPLS